MAAGDRRAQLLAAAATAFLRGGFDGTSMDDVARQAGVTRLVVYKHFESKQAVYRSVLDAVVTGLQEQLRRLDAASSVERGGVVRALLAVARADPDGFRLLWRHAAYEPEFASYAADFRSLADAFTESALDSRAVPEPLHRWAARSLSAFVVDGVCTWLDEGDPAADDLFVERHAAAARALLDALTDRAQQPPRRRPVRSVRR